MNRVRLKFLIYEIICVGLLSSSFKEFSFLTDIEFVEQLSFLNEIKGLEAAHKLAMLNYYRNIFGWVGILLASAIAFLLSKKLRIEWYYPLVVFLVGVLLKIIGFLDSDLVNRIMFLFRNMVSTLPIIYIYSIDGILLFLVFITINILFTLRYHANLSRGI
jgi:hypothetical protein